MWSSEFEESEDHGEFDDYDRVDEDADDASATLPCPSCGQAVFEETEKCPYCGDWIMPLRHAARPPVWARAVGLVLAIALVLALAGGVVRWFF